MSIQSEITRITGARNDSFTAVASKGVTVPTGSTIDDLPTLIGQISGGGGSDISTETYYGDNCIDFDGNVPTFMYTSGSSIIFSQIIVAGSNLPEELAEVSFTMSYYDENNSVGYFSCGSGETSDFPTGSYIITLSATEQSDVFEVLVYNCDDWTVSSPDGSELTIYTIAPSGGGSGGVSLPVIGGTTRPSSPADNTVWVNTSVAIGNWYVQNTAPSSPSAGDVWITLKPSISNVIDISGTGTFLVGFGRTQQYVSSAWRDVNAELYNGNSWMPLQTYLYNLGDLCTETTSGWTIYKAGNNNLNTFEGTYLNHDYKSTSGYRGIFITDQTIDVTEYTQIHLDYEVTSAGNTGSNYTGGLYFTTATGSITNAENASTGLITFHVASQARTVATVDITNYTGSYYIMTRGNYQKWKAFRIWMTK